MLTVYPKKGGNIQVATKVLELLVGESPVKKLERLMNRELTVNKGDPQTRSLVVRWQAASDVPKTGDQPNLINLDTNKN